MAVLQVKNLHKSYGPRIIFDDVTASFSTEQKIGMIGRNGAGKSTLCKIVLGDEEADSGTVIQSSDLRLSYLEQHDPFQADETVADFLVRYTNREEWECAMLANKFQIRHEHFYEPVKKLSGGYQTRVKLSAMLLRDPNFLILDEPSNYLDLNTLILLENFLHSFRGGYLIVSHDREFLKRTCEYTCEADQGELVVYPGNVEEYLDSKEQKKAQAASVNKNIETKQKQLQRFVDRFGTHAAKASMAKSKLKQIERLERDKIGIQHEAGTVRMRIPSVEERSGTVVLTDSLAIGYPEKTVANNINVECQRGSKVAILGENGQGKTTFMKTLAGDLPPVAGSFKWASNIKIGYYAQHVFSSLDPRHDVFGHLSSVAADGVSRQEILDIAGCFLFSGDDVNKKVPVLSGGERSRLILAGLLVSKCNVLLLDEPTNHLDFETVETLGEALLKFNGSIFFICHDRTFVNMVANEILDVSNGSIKRYPGTYEDYVDFLERMAEDEMAEPGTDKKSEKKKPAKKNEQALKEEFKELEEQIKKTESDIAALKAEKDAICQELIANASAYSRERHERLDKVTKLLEKEEALWVELAEQLEKLKKQ